MEALGLYISIPFCRSKCTYCNFSSGNYPAGEHARYVERVIEDLRGAQRWAKKMGVELPRRVDTVYLGGGTPSLLEPELLARLFACVGDEFAVDSGAEITMECAPGQLADATLEAMAECGVNRVSLGVQSFVDAEARRSGRLHSRAVVERDLLRLQAAGIANLNVDLIAGLAGQTLASWEESLSALLDAGVPHASVYMLEVDEDSRLGRELLSGGARYGAGLVPGDDAIAHMYERAIARLAEAGLEAGLAQYEISNFSLPGWESRHNLRYWQRRPYLGVGLDASSMLRESSPASGCHLARGEVNERADGSVTERDRGTRISGSRAEKDARNARALAPASAYVLRSTTTDDLKAYLAGPQPSETAWTSPQRQHEEVWFLGLRLNAGVAVATVEQEFGGAMVAPALETAQRLAADGLLDFDGHTVRLTPQGRLLSNEVFQEFLATAVA